MATSNIEQIYQYLRERMNEISILLKNQNLSKNFRDQLTSIFNNLNGYDNAPEGEEGDGQRINSVSNAIVHINALNGHAKNEANQELAIKIAELASYALSQQIVISNGKKQITDDELERIQGNPFKRVAVLANEKERVASEQLLNDFRQNLGVTREQYIKEFDSLRVQMNELEQKLQSSVSQVEKPLSDAITLYSETNNYLNTKKEEINKLLGFVSQNVVDDDYKKSAKNEKLMADVLRGIAGAFMIAMVVFVGIAFWHTTNSIFDWKTGLFRIGFAFALSIPAAYFARESAKHREYQYRYHSMALDLKALDPFIASLPEPERISIKQLVSGRLFAISDPSKSSDSFPLNPQEIVIELIKKINPK